MQTPGACTAVTVAVPEWKVSVLAVRWGCALQPASPSKVTTVARRTGPLAVLIGGGAWGPELATLAWHLATERLAPALLLIGPNWRRPPEDGVVEETENVLWGVVPETAERAQWESELKRAADRFARAKRPMTRRGNGLMRSAPSSPETVVRPHLLGSGGHAQRPPLAALAEGLLRQGALASAHRPRALVTAPGADRPTAH